MINESPINWNQLAMILGEVEDPIDEEMADLFRDFIEDAGRRLDTLDSVDPVSEPQRVAHEAHKIRGAALSFGFERFAAVLQTVETRVLELSPDEISRLLAAARELFTQSKVEVGRSYAYLAVAT
jgi:HPt (histidine-containing phosphotransfer) domain-containing protein